MLDMLHQFEPHDTVVFHQHGALKRGEMCELVLAWSDRLTQLGLKPRERVMILLPNSLELLIAYYACLASGVIAVPANVRLVKREIRAMADHCSPSLLITSRDALLKTGLSEMDLDCAVDVVDAIAPEIERGHGVAGFKNFDDDHPATIFYTSGSTGAPKGVLYSHRTLRAASMAYREYYRLTGDDQTVLCHCMAHNFMFSQLACPVLDAGGSVHIVNFGNAPQAARSLQQGVSYIKLIPWFALALTDYCIKHQIRAPKLRHFVVGGDRVPSQVFEQCLRAFGIEASQNIGMTETNTYAVCPGEQNDHKRGSAGLPLPGFKLDIRDDTGAICPIGESGQIWVKSGANMEAYWNDKEITRQTMHDGWVSTGDSGHLDSDGFLWFDGRIRNIIICDGDNIYPSEVERVLSEHPALGQVAVFGLTDPEHGERVAAAVVRRENFTTDSQALRCFLELSLTAGKIPTDWLFLDSLPTTRAGKTDLQMLRTIYGQPESRNDQGNAHEHG